MFILCKLFHQPNPGSLKLSFHALESPLSCRRLRGVRRSCSSDLDISKPCRQLHTYNWFSCKSWWSWFSMQLSRKITNTEIHRSKILMLTIQDSKLNIQPSFIWTVQSLDQRLTNLYLKLWPPPRNLPMNSKHDCCVKLSTYS